MQHEFSAPRLILGSSSVYRAELLRRLRVPFSIAVPEIDERPTAGESASHTAQRLALQKAQKVASQVEPAVIIGSDQVAVLDGEHIGKPGNHASALQQLERMQGRTVIFHTALCVLDARTQPEIIQRALVDTAVTFRNLPTELLDRYLHIEQPYDCAGSAKNEGLGIALIASLSSADPTALTGLPLIALSGMLMKAGVDLFNTATQ